MFIIKEASVLATPMSDRRDDKCSWRVATARRDLPQTVWPTEPSGLRSDTITPIGAIL
jgi:hypothetical protein